MLGVGVAAEKYAHDLFHLSDVDCKRMFMIGLFHDCGYHYAIHQHDHPAIGADLMEYLGVDYEYCDVVRRHGDPNISLDGNTMLTILNLADMTTSAAGRPVNLASRLDDVGVRYGESSSQYRDMDTMIEHVLEQLHQHHIVWDRTTMME